MVQPWKEHGTSFFSWHKFCNYCIAVFVFVFRFFGPDNIRIRMYLINSDTNVKFNIRLETDTNSDIDEKFQIRIRILTDSLRICSVYTPNSGINHLKVNMNEKTISSNMSWQSNLLEVYNVCFILLSEYLNTNALEKW